MSRIYFFQRAFRKLRLVQLGLPPFLLLTNLFLASGLSAQEAIELSRNSNPGSIPGGPSTANQSVNFLRSTSTGNFVPLAKPISITASISNQQFTNVRGEMSTGLAFGTSVFTPMNEIASPSDASFTSNPEGPAGTGINVTQNYSFYFYASTNMWNRTSGPSGKRAYYGDIEFTFSQPVSNPVLQLTGAGARIKDINTMTVEFELPTGSGLTLTKLSGSDELSIPVSADKILNKATKPGAACGDGAACGSVRINGNDITSVKLKVYLRFYRSNFSFGRNSNSAVGVADCFLVGFSGAVFNDGVGNKEQENVLPALPVLFNSFTANISSNKSNEVLLKWQISPGSDNRGFTIQHSNDGPEWETREWETIAFVDAAGNSQRVTDYEYNHRNVSKGEHYYRIWQEGLSGASTLSQISNVNVSATGTDIIAAIQTYPNPVTGVLHITASGQNELKAMSLVDISGSKLMSRQLSQRQYSLDISTIPTGTYVLVVQYRDGTFAYEKIIKK
jgi:hypothetical protein